MRALIIAVVLLSGCTTLQSPAADTAVTTGAVIADYTAPPLPAPLASTKIDDTALETAWRSYDAALDAINLLIDAKVIVPGSPKALALADANDKVLAALTAAEAAAAAGSTTRYTTALANIKVAIAEMRVVLRRK